MFFVFYVFQQIPIIFLHTVGSKSQTVNATILSNSLHVDCFTWNPLWWCQEPKLEKLSSVQKRMEQTVCSWSLHGNAIFQAHTDRQAPLQYVIFGLGDTVPMRVEEKSAFD